LEIYLQVPFTELHNLIWLLANGDGNMKACKVAPLIQIYLFIYLVTVTSYIFF